MGYRLVDCNPKFVLNTYVFDKLGTGQAKSGFVPYSERITDFFARWPGASKKARPLE